MAFTTFDAADIFDLAQRDVLVDVALHELGHSLGLGVLWPSYSLVTTGGQYVGSHGLRGYRTINDVSNDDDHAELGTSGGHWSEGVLGNELMTPLIGDGAQPLSKVTLLSLIDLGYAIRENTADDFLVSNAFVERRDRSGTYGDDIIGEGDGFGLDSLISSDFQPGLSRLGSVILLASCGALGLVLCAIVGACMVRGCSRACTRRATSKVVKKVAFAEEVVDAESDASTGTRTASEIDVESLRRSRSMRRSFAESLMEDEVGDDDAVHAQPVFGDSSRAVFAVVET